MDKQEVNNLKKDVQRLKTTQKKLIDSVEKSKEKIQSLQSELADLEKSLSDTNKELSEKEAQLKRADYSTALQKLDDATLSSLTKRQVELLAEHILSGTISSLLEDNSADENNNEPKPVVTSNND